MTLHPRYPSRDRVVYSRRNDHATEFTQRPGKGDDVTRDCNRSRLRDDDREKSGSILARGALLLAFYGSNRFAVIQSVRWAALVRRLLAFNLTVVLLGPWLAALSGAAVPVVPCPMHRSGGATNHSHAGAGISKERGVEHHGPSKHGSSALGCNCVGECGRVGAGFTVPTRVYLSSSSNAIAEATPSNRGLDFGSAARLRPHATGPPQRLLI